MALEGWKTNGTIVCPLQRAESKKYEPTSFTAFRVRLFDFVLRCIAFSVLLLFVFHGAMNRRYCRDLERRQIYNA